MLLTAQLNSSGVVARHHTNTKSNVIAGTYLVNEPSDAVCVMGFVTGHHVSWSAKVAGPGNRLFQCAMLCLAVAVRNVVWVDINTPWTFLALVSALEFPVFVSHVHRSDYGRELMMILLVGGV